MDYPQPSPNVFVLCFVCVCVCAGSCVKNMISNYTSRQTNNRKTMDAVQRPNVGGGVVEAVVFVCGCVVSLKQPRDTHKIWSDSLAERQKTTIVEKMAWPFLVGGAICLVNSDNERDLNLLNSDVIPCEGRILTS